MAVETVTLTIEGPDGTDELTLPAALLDMLSEGDETDAEVVGDLALFGCAQRVHGAIHHQQREPSEELAAVEEATMDLFEERFGMTYGEATGHQH
ncbi:MAG: hypothetical protein ABEJ23_04640 [Haloarculaceae archaeon]